MPRFYFHLKSKEARIPDDSGKDFDTLNDAYKHGLKLINKISLRWRSARAIRRGMTAPWWSGSAGRCRQRDPPPPTFSLRVAALSRRHPGQNHFAGRNPEAAAGDMRPIHDPGLFAIGSDLFLVVAAAVVGDFEDFVSEVFRLTLAREHTCCEIPDCWRSTFPKST